jgi:hypothetical protein
VTGEQKREVIRLREGFGLSVTAIALRLGVPRSSVGNVICPPKKLRCECGGERVQGATRCRPCEEAHRAWLRDRKVEIVAGMYEDGWTGEEMTLVLGRAVPTDKTARMARVGPELHEARKRGLIGYRYAAYETRAAA